MNINQEKIDYYEKIINKQVGKLEELLKKDKIEESLLHELMIQLIDEAPEEIHENLFIKFTYLLGRKLGLDNRKITTELIKN